MTKYNVTGMSCAACSARVEKAVGALEGVDGVSVSLLTNSMMVEGSATSGEVIEAVVNAGYGASLAGQARDQHEELTYSGSNEIFDDMEETLKDRETPILRRRFIASVILLLPLIYVSMGHTMWGFALPNIIGENCMAIGLIQLILASVIMLINQKFFVNGVR